MAERRCRAHADVEQSDGGTLIARKPRGFDPSQSVAAMTAVVAAHVVAVSAGSWRSIDRNRVPAFSTGRSLVH